MKPQPHISVETLPDGRDEIRDFASGIAARKYGMDRRAQGAIIYVFESEMAVRLGLDPRRIKPKLVLVGGTECTRQNYQF